MEKWRGSVVSIFHLGSDIPWLCQPPLGGACRPSGLGSPGRWFLTVTPAPGLACSGQLGKEEVLTGQPRASLRQSPRPCILAPKHPCVTRPCLCPSANASASDTHLARVDCFQANPSGEADGRASRASGLDSQSPTERTGRPEMAPAGRTPSRGAAEGPG